MDIYNLYSAAMVTPSGTPQAQCARAVCGLRGLDSEAYVPTPYGSLPQWQAIIFEQLLLRLAAL